MARENNSEDSVCGKPSHLLEIAFFAALSALVIVCSTASECFCSHGSTSAGVRATVELVHRLDLIAATTITKMCGPGWPKTEEYARLPSSALPTNWTGIGRHSDTIGNREIVSELQDTGTRTGIIVDPPVLA